MLGIAACQVSALSTVLSQVLAKGFNDTMFFGYFKGAIQMISFWLFFRSCIKMLRAGP